MFANFLLLSQENVLLTGRDWLSSSFQAIVHDAVDHKLLVLYDSFVSHDPDPDCMNTFDCFQSHISFERVSFSKWSVSLEKKSVYCSKIARGTC